MAAKIVLTTSGSSSIDPLRRILSELPSDLDAAIVVARHRAAAPGSLFAKMLREVTGLTVVTAEGRLPIAPATVYVLPPDAGARLTAPEVLEVTVARGPQRRRARFDALVGSVVSFYGPDVIALQLSGGAAWSPQSLHTISLAGGAVVLEATGSLARHPPDPSTLVQPLSELSFLLARLVEAGPVRHLLTGVS